MTYVAEVTPASGAPKLVVVLSSHTLHGAKREASNKFARAEYDTITICYIVMAPRRATGTDTYRALSTRLTTKGARWDDCRPKPMR